MFDVLFLVATWLSLPFCAFACSRIAARREHEITIHFGGPCPAQASGAGAAFLAITRRNVSFWKGACKIFLGIFFIPVVALVIYGFLIGLPTETGTETLSAIAAAITAGIVSSFAAYHGYAIIRYYHSGSLPWCMTVLAGTILTFGAPGFVFLVGHDPKALGFAAVAVVLCVQPGIIAAFRKAHLTEGVVTSTA